jgi:hypothetical protein
MIYIGGATHKKLIKDGVDFSGVDTEVESAVSSAVKAASKGPKYGLRQPNLGGSAAPELPKLKETASQPTGELEDMGRDELVNLVRALRLNGAHDPAPVGTPAANAVGVDAADMEDAKDATAEEEDDDYWNC